MLSLIAAAVLSQTVYTWVDASGVTHYTDDASKVPARAKQTQGADINVLPAPPPLPRPPPAPPQPPLRPPPPPAEPEPEYGAEPEPTSGYPLYPLWWAPGYRGAWGRPSHVTPAPPPPVKVQAPPPRPTPSAGRTSTMVPHAAGGRP